MFNRTSCCSLATRSSSTSFDRAQRNVKRYPYRVIASVLSVVSWAIPVHAQAPEAPRQPQGLFGGVKPDAAATTRLDVTTSLVENYDEDVPLSLLNVLDPQSLQTGGFSTLLNTSASYVRKTARTQLGINGNSLIRHYPDLGGTRAEGGFGAGISARLPGRLTLMANQAGAFTPAHLSGLFPTGVDVEPGTPGTSATDYNVSEFESYTYSSTLSLRRDFSARSSLAFSGDFQYIDRKRESLLWEDVSSYLLAGEYSRNVNRSTAITAHYRYHTGAFGYTNDLETTEHAIEFGVSYSKGLSPTRRASVRFSAGASAADVPQVTQTGNAVFRQYLGRGSADFEYQFQRTWQARANYRRGLEYVVDIPEPVFANSLGVGVDGLVTRRIDINLSAGYSSGASILNSSALAYDTYTGSIRVRYALSRLVATYAEYLYYFYDFAAGTPLLVGVPPGLERNGVRVGFTVWTPALRK